MEGCNPACLAIVKQAEFFCPQIGDRISSSVCDLNIHRDAMCDARTLFTIFFGTSFKDGTLGKDRRTDQGDE